MKEINNVEIVAEENEAIAVPEEKKDGIVKKAGKFVKANWKKGIALAVVGVGGFLLGTHTSGKSEDGEYAGDFEVIEADDYTVEDIEDAE